MRFLTCLILVVSCAVCLVVPAAADDANQAAVHLDAKVEVQMDYLLYLPKDYDKQKSWPLVLFLHGAGERGDDLDLVKMHGPPRLVEEGKEFPFIVVSPQCPKGRWWREFELMALLDDVIATHNVDEDRVYVTGLSMGGFGSWGLAAFSPDRFAAIAPICGGGEPRSTRNFTHVPVWAFHGAKDTAVPLERTQAMIDALKRQGAEPKLTIYPEAGHDSWTETYNNPAFYEWLLAQKRVAQED
ncbi:Endo-1,4-beta-xylanase Z precursor [Rosistilla ulvae]|uniref:Endo-1,4-beta-xylanase Z n=1 Tax=Rosistilla ulvae TaxID=1930277 RepID=A0A517LYX1_9BACT|nr:prolyl oligopeptidase family serine peptidase [Rosistilla ulvae]QDS87821.1 Endo-1,4-beta-xylanase Z precursor [Rosistilla ulvae]